jgi:hypothetical protein
MPVTPVNNPGMATTPGAAAGVGAVATLLAYTESGHHGRCQLVAGTGAVAGRLATIMFANPGGHPRTRCVSPLPGNPDVLVVGALEDPDIRPIILTVHPASLPGTVFHAEPVINVQGQMTGFAVHCTGVLSPGAVHTLAWHVI